MSKAVKQPSNKSKKSKEIEDFDVIKAYIKREEGFKNNVYKDSLGKWTVGVGHLLPAAGQQDPVWWWRKFTDTHGNTHLALMQLFDQDARNHINDVARKLCDYDKQTLSVRMALASMSFQFGGKMLGYDNTQRMLQSGLFLDLAESLEHWKAMKQTPARMRRNQALFSLNTNCQRTIKIILDAIR